MATFQILAGAHKGKTIISTRYQATASGVAIQMTHNVPKSAGKLPRWVQTISENGSFYRRCGRSSYVDPFARTGVKDAAGKDVL